MSVSYRKSREIPAISGLNAPNPGQRVHNRAVSSFQIYHPATGKSWWLSTGANRLGRGFDNDIVLIDNTISRQHARINVSGGSVHIEDTGSVNGVFVAGERVRQSTLFVDACFRLGTVDLVLRRLTGTESGNNRW